jgi:hypothetical protein
MSDDSVMPQLECCVCLSLTDCNCTVCPICYGLLECDLDDIGNWVPCSCSHPIN